MVASKREGMKAFEPAMIGIASVLGFSKLQHRFKVFLEIQQTLGLESLL
jgi:hypothetical protein